MGSPLLLPPAGNGLNSIFKAPLQLGSQEVLTSKLHDPLLSFSLSCQVDAENVGDGC